MQSIEHLRTNIEAMVFYISYAISPVLALISAEQRHEDHRCSMERCFHARTNHEPFSSQQCHSVCNPAMSPRQWDAKDGRCHCTEARETDTLHGRHEGVLIRMKVLS
jgi:hypothetical protein